MVDLSAQSPLLGQNLPLEIGGVIVDEVSPGPVQSIMPFEGQGGALSALLQNALGLSLPEPGQVHTNDGAEIIWTGRNQWFLCAERLDIGEIGAVTDQSDAWAVLSIRGDVAGEVMARLCPLDLRHFEPGQVARTEFAHMMSIILPRVGGYDIWVMRSFAKTALHHMTDAAHGLAAIKALPS